MEGGPRRVLVAPDSFKGTFGGTEVAEMIAAPLAERGLEVDRCPLGDGGEGTLEVLLGALGGVLATVAARDALGRPIDAEIGLAPGGRVAIVETAAAVGLARIDPDERDPEAATTTGAGELIAAAARRARWVIVGVGGSATNDGGAGALEAVASAGGVGGSRLVCLCDVRTPWELASETYGPQKGADPDAVRRLARRLDDLAARLPRDPRGVSMSGAAGGLSGGLWAGLGARLVLGAGFVCGLVGFDGRARRADAVVTGEGRLDATTAEGKVVSEVAARCRRLGVPVHAVVGEDATDGPERARLGLASVIEAGDPDSFAAAGERLAAALAP